MSALTRRRTYSKVSPLRVVVVRELNLVIGAVFMGFTFFLGEKSSDRSDSSRDFKSFYLGLVVSAWCLAPGVCM